jgi:virginiamycin B lyase
MKALTIAATSALLALRLAGGSIPGLTTAPINIPASAGAMAKDASGNLWLLDAKQNAVDRLTASGAFTSFQIPTASAQPYAIAASPDGAIWFTETGVGAAPKGKIARVASSGVITEFPLPSTMNGGPWQIAIGPDGNAWFLELVDGKHVGRVTPSGAFSEFAPPNAQFLATIAPATDGLWLIDTNANSIAKMSTDGSITSTQSIPSGPSYSGAAGVTAFDGTFWFIHGTNGIARITASGTVTEYGVPTGGANPAGVALGGDGTLWFSEYSGNRIGQVIVGSGGNVTINESDPFGQKLADILFVPHATTSKTGALLDDACLPDDLIVRKDDGTSGNMIRVRIAPPSSCANLGVFPDVLQFSRVFKQPVFNFELYNGGKDDVADATVRLTLFPSFRSVQMAFIDCQRPQFCGLQGSAIVCSNVAIKANDTCGGQLYLNPTPGLDDVLIVNMTISSSLFDQYLTNNAAMARIDTRVNEAMPLPPDSLTPVVTNPVKRGGH